MFSPAASCSVLVFRGQPRRCKAVGAQGRHRYRCTDGSYTTAKTQARGCLKHGGVKTWFSSSTTSAGASPAATAAPAPAATAAPSDASVKARPRVNPKMRPVSALTAATSTAKTEARGCLKHGGVKTWFGPAAGAAETSAPAATAAPAAPVPSAPAATPSAIGFLPGLRHRSRRPRRPRQSEPPSPYQIGINGDPAGGETPTVSAKAMRATAIAGIGLPRMKAGW